MIHLVYGGSGSGKSSYAESLIVALDNPKKVYLATMKVFGEEGKAKVRRHQEQRSGKGFRTVECPVDVGNCSCKGETVLLECLSNLVANEMFRVEGVVERQAVVKKIADDLEKLMMTAENLVVVSNNVFEDGTEYDETTSQYMAALEQINEFVAQKADYVTEVVVGIPVCVKNKEKMKI